MSLKERITEDMKTALRSGDKAKLSLIRMLRSDIRYKDMGKVMRVIMPRVKGRADGKRVSQSVSLRLQEK